MSLLNHEVGGVTVTLEDDMTSLDPEMKKGTTLTLTDHQAELLIQTRYAMDDDRNTERMRRQQIFMKAFMNKMKEKMQRMLMLQLNCMTDCAHMRQKILI